MIFQLELSWQNASKMGGNPLCVSVFANAQKKSEQPDDAEKRSKTSSEGE
jgi:hypothetical protein